MTLLRFILFMAPVVMIILVVVEKRNRAKELKQLGIDSKKGIQARHDIGYRDYAEMDKQKKLKEQEEKKKQS